MAGALVLAQQPPCRPAPRDPQRELATSVADGFTLAAVGDCIIARPISPTPGFAPVGKHDADVAFGNFVFQLDLLEPVGSDLYEQYKMDGAAATDAEFNAMWNQLVFGGDVWYQSVVATTRFERGRQRRSSSGRST